MRETIGIISTNFNSFNTLANGLKEAKFSIVNYDITNESWKKNLHHLPAILFLDLNLGFIDGIELCEQIKSSKPSTVVIIFSDEKEEFIEIEAYRSGVDDFINKGINPALLLRKIKAFLKWSIKIETSSEENVINYQNITINRDRYLVQRNDKEYDLQKKQFELLYLLISNPKKIFSREELYQAVWKTSETSNLRIIDVHIRKIRRKIGEDIIKTVKGNGYRIC